MQQQGLYCVTCGRQTLHNSVGGVNHVLHFLIGFLTCGLWWFVWLLLVMNDSPTPRCAFCGTQYDHRRAVAAYAEASGIELPQAPALKPLTPEEKAARARETWRNLAILAGVIVLFAVGSVALVAFLSRQPAPSRPVGRPSLPAAAATPTPRPSLTVAEIEAMAKAIRSTGERCGKITRQFFQGVEPKSGTRIWNFTCTPGGDYSVSIGPKGGKVLSCSVLRELGTPCFEAFR